MGQSKKLASLQYHMTKWWCPLRLSGLIA